MYLLCLFNCLIKALSDCVKDLLKPFQNESIDIVAGIDAMGFILGKLGGKQGAGTHMQHRMSSHTLGVFYFEYSTHSDTGRN